MVVYTTIYGIYHHMCIYHQQYRAASRSTVLKLSGATAPLTQPPTITQR